MLRTQFQNNYSKSLPLRFWFWFWLSNFVKFEIVAFSAALKENSIANSIFNVGLKDQNSSYKWVLSQCVFLNKRII